VDAINISLAGPANRVVAAAVDTLADANVLLIAAVGNDGPFAEPRFPAAYNRVVGVTAVDRSGRLYSRAGRGSHVDYAGPGVAVHVAEAGSGAGFTEVSGTSYATPLITGLLLAYRGERDESLVTLSDRVAADLIDLGQPGRDPLYGDGLPGKRWVNDALPLSE
jgi:subtilisin family serine protease